MGSISGQRSALDPPDPQMPHLGGTSPHDGILFGRFGLRAGWGIAIFLVLFFILSAVARISALAATGRVRQTIAQHKTHSADQKTEAHTSQTIMVDDTIIGEGLDLLGVALAAAILSFLERRRIAAYGIGSAR